MKLFLVAGAAFFVFVLFFLVFAIKRRESDEPVRIHNCHNCGCGKKEAGHLERFRQRTAQEEKSPAKAGRSTALVRHRRIHPDSGFDGWYATSETEQNSDNTDKCNSKKTDRP